MSRISKIINNDNGILVPLVDRFLLEVGNSVQIVTTSDRKIVDSMMDMQSERQEDRRQRTTFSASASPSCMREQGIAFIDGYERKSPSDPRTVTIFDDGNWRNLRWILIFNKMGILKRYETTQTRKKYNVSGTPDAEADLSAFYPDDSQLKDVGIEIKGMNMWEFSKFKNGESNSKWARSRFMQVQTYMLIKKRKMWIIWGENKNTQEYAENVIYRDPDVIKYLQRRFRYQLEARKLSMLPAIECDLHESDAKFKYCAQNKNCMKLIDEQYPTLSSMKDRKKLDRMVTRRLRGLQ